jgi:large subunit ribosomal protein L24
MKTKFNSKWKESKKPSKQRLYRYNAPKHTKSKLMGAHLSEELMKKYQKRAVRVRKGDKVEIKRGQFKGRSGKVERVNIKTGKIYVSKIESQKIDGTKVFYPIHPSNVIVVELNLEDKKRTDILKRK